MGNKATTEDLEVDMEELRILQASATEVLVAFSNEENIEAFRDLAKEEDENPKTLEVDED